MFHRSISFFGIACLFVSSLFAQQAGAAQTTGAALQAGAEKSSVESTAPAAIKESWTVLSISQLDLESDPPIPGGESELPEFTRELIRLQWRTGDPIDIYVIKPHGIQRPRVILYLYGHTSDSARFRNDQWCKSATEGGFAAVGFVSALTGERYHGWAMKKWFVSELAESLGSTTHDVQKILDYLVQRGDLNTEHAGMYAQGSGASIAILAASVDPRITVLDLLNPWGDWPDWLKESAIIPDSERPSYLRQEFLAQVAKLDPADILPKLKTQTIRVQQVTGDWGTPNSVQERIGSAAPRPEQVVRYKDTAGLKKAWEEGRPWGWIKENLAPSSPQSSTAGLQTSRSPHQ
jgi:hypothetical protein